jgi:iron complex outermembrane receptor protein
MKQLMVLWAWLFFSQAIYAQAILEGKVTTISDKPLAGTTVYLPEQNKGTICNKDGYYRFENLPLGKIKIQFSFIGYNTEIQTINVSEGINVLNIELTEAVIQSQEVVITGGYVSSQHENAVKIDVLNSRDILLAGTPNFTESLTQIPGIDMISKGPGVSKPVIRGLSMNDVLVLNNGVRIENYQFSENHPLGIDGNDVERIEIIKGPASLLYGSDAIGGVLNFVKEKPAPADKIVGDYQMQFYSNTLGMINNLGVKGSSGNFFGGFRVGHKTHADYLQGGGDYVPNSRFNELTFNANTGYSGKIGTFKVFYDYFKQDLGMTVPDAVPLINERGRENENWYQDLKHQLVSSQNSLFLGKFKWDINAAYQLADRKLQTTLDFPFVEMNLKTFTYESKLYFPSDIKSEYILGVQGMYQNNRNLNNRPSQFLPDANINNAGILGLIKHSFSQHFILQGGLRFDRYQTETFALGEKGTDNYQAPVSKNFSNLNGSLGLTYQPIEKIILRANIAKGYRVPNLSELTSNGMHGNRYEIGNDSLSPENAYETDISLHYHGDFLSFDLAGFYNIIDHYIYVSPTDETTSSGVNIYRYSQSNAALFGGETSIRFHPESIQWMQLVSSFSSVIGKKENGEYLPFIPAHKFRNEIQLKRKKLDFLHEPALTLSAITALAQNHPSPFETPTPGYTLINLNINAELIISKQHWLLGITATNLFDKKYIDHLSTLKPMNYSNPGRNISLMVTIPFEIN